MSKLAKTHNDLICNNKMVLLQNKYKTLKNLAKVKGFTLIELLVVISIIGLLASVIIISLSSARSRARDTKRRTDLRNIIAALQAYHIQYGNYIVTDPTSGQGTGYNACGCGWFSYQTGIAPYIVSVATGLRNAGVISGIPKDPSGRDAGGGTGNASYMVYTTGSGGTQCVSVYASLENPTAADTQSFNNACAGTGPSIYNMNYAVSAR